MDKPTYMRYLRECFRDYICSRDFDPEASVDEWVVDSLECRFTHSLPERERYRAERERALEATREEFSSSIEAMRQLYAKVVLLRTMEMISLKENSDAL